VHRIIPAHSFFVVLNDCGDAPPVKACLAGGGQSITNPSSDENLPTGAERRHRYPISGHTFLTGEQHPASPANSGRPQPNNKNESKQKIFHKLIDNLLSFFLNYS
jgi:hypothetical protein